MKTINRDDTVHGESYVTLADALEHAAAEVAKERERWQSVVFDGWAVLKHLDDAACQRTSHQNVSDVLDAVMRAIRAQKD